MEIREYPLPVRPGEVLCSPRLAEWERCIGTHQGRVPGWNFSVLGMPGAELRRRTRFRLWGKSEHDPLIVTGHQPVFFHGGIWIKCFAVRQAVAHIPGASGYYVNVDSDHVAELDMWLPGADEEGLVRRRIGIGLVPGLPLERQPVPGEAEWDALARAGGEVLATLPPEAGRDQLLERWNRFAAIVRQERDHMVAAGITGKGLARLMASCRRRLEEEEGDVAAKALGLPRDQVPTLGETYVSSISETPEFARFALAWMAEAERLKDVYNGQLARYRRARGYRSKANPFPDLRRYGEQIEVPFWCVDPKEGRADLFVVPQGGGRITLTTRHGELLQLDLNAPEEAVDQLLAAAVNLRPKAVPLSLFLRMFASDLFVHGVGGGRYDHITDGVIRGWWGVEPPVYAVVSASLPLPLAAAREGNPGEEDDFAPSYWKAQLWALRYNPQRFVDSPNPAPKGLAEDVAALKAEKEHLIEAIGQPGAPKRELTRRIEAVNAALYERLRDVEAEFQEALRRAEKTQRRRAVEEARDYPFFLHSTDVLWEALTRA